MPRLRCWLILAVTIAAAHGFACGTGSLRAPPQRTALLRASEDGSGDDRGSEYYKGMLNSPLDARSDEDLDNVTPNLKFVAIATVAVVSFIGAFLASNEPPPASFS